MTLPFSPVLLFHICAGLVGLFSGAIAITVRKGSRRHRAAGNVFVIAMLSLAVTAIYMAVLKQQITNILGGVLTLYLVTTGWLAGRQTAGTTSKFDSGALVFALAVGSIQWVLGIEAATSPTGLKFGYPAPLYFVFGSVLMIAAVGDIRMLVRGGVFGTQRIARHLWRMCFGLFIASGSFFLGQQQVIPAAFRNTAVLMFLSFLPLALMIFWLVRVYVKKRYVGRTIPRPRLSSV